MKKKTSTYNPKSRRDISNPYNNISHDDLLKKAGGKKFNGNYEVVKLSNGRIEVKSTK